MAAVLFLLIPPCALPQSSPGTGTVTGQAYCSDTQKPARFAIVTLGSTGSGENEGGRRGAGSNGTTTGPDGSFTIKNVPAGTYDLQVTQPGYVQALRQLNYVDDTDPVKQQPWLRMLTRITVLAGQNTNTLATAYRGADLQGVVIYDDGSPASGILVSTLLAHPGAGGTASTITAANADLRPFNVSSITDDRGHFSLSGLAEGAYTVEAAPRGGGIFPVYLGNTIDRSQAQLVTLKTGDVRADLEMQMAIANLHQVRGVLASGNNHALPNVRVSLSLATGGTNALHDTTAADGSFSFSNVPDGKFTVSAAGVRDPDSTAFYKSTSTQITVSGSDITDVALTSSQ